MNTVAPLISKICMDYNISGVTYPRPIEDLLHIGVLKAFGTNNYEIIDKRLDEYLMVDHSMLYIAFAERNPLAMLHLIGVTHLLPSYGMMSSICRTAINDCADRPPLCDVIVASVEAGYKLNRDQFSYMPTLNLTAKVIQATRVPFWKRMCTHATSVPNVPPMDLVLLAFSLDIDTHRASTQDICTQLQSLTRLRCLVSDATRQLPRSSKSFLL